MSAVASGPRGARRRWSSSSASRPAASFVTSSHASLRPTRRTISRRRRLSSAAAGPHAVRLALAARELPPDAVPARVQRAAAQRDPARSWVGRSAVERLWRGVDSAGREARLRDREALLGARPVHVTAFERMPEWRERCPGSVAAMRRPHPRTRTTSSTASISVSGASGARVAVPETPRREKPREPRLPFAGALLAFRSPWRVQREALADAPEPDDRAAFVDAAAGAFARSHFRAEIAAVEVDGDPRSALRRGGPAAARSHRSMAARASRRLPIRRARPCARARRDVAASRIADLISSLGERCPCPVRQWRYEERDATARRRWVQHAAVSRGHHHDPGAGRRPRPTPLLPPGHPSRPPVESGQARTADGPRRSGRQPLGAAESEGVHERRSASTSGSPTCPARTTSSSTSASSRDDASSDACSATGRNGRATGSWDPTRAGLRSAPV